MIAKLKNIIRNTLNFLHLDITKNLKYDRLTIQIMKKVIQHNSNCIDVGCHKGEILTKIIELSPDGKHFAFEPIPSFYKKLIDNFNEQVTILPFALSNSNGSTSFQFVKNAPAYSGIKKRKYAISNPEIEEIDVELKKLDDVIPESIIINFIKIDVEGAEFDVLKGAKELVLRCKPVIIFEFGLGANDFYNSSPENLFDFLTNETALKISSLENWLKNKTSYSKNEFVNCFNKGDEYYFIAYP